MKKPSVALKSILRSSEGKTDIPTLPTDLSILRDEKTGQLITTPKEVIARLTQLETKALSPDPTLPPGAPFPWLSHVRPTPASPDPMLIDQINPAIFQEALRRTPNHKAAGPDGVPGICPRFFMRSSTSSSKPWLLRGSPPLLGSRATRSSSIKRGTRLGSITTAQSLLQTPYINYGPLA
jgi:hypothetical protein